MIIKKKLAKKTATKSNRGRPRKEFKSKHVRIKEQNQTSTEIVEHKIPKYEKILRIPNKDKSIFYLFIFSIILFLCSIVISFVKKHDIQKLQSTQEENTGKIIVQTGTEMQETGQVSIGSVIQTVENMYETINNKNFDELANYWNASLKSSNTVRTYFNTKRLTRFVDNIKNGGIVISDIKQTQLKNYNRQITYKLSYTLSNDQTFNEQWNATIVQKNNTYSIATIKCETTGCSRMPFFNPGKFNIK